MEWNGGALEKTMCLSCEKEEEGNRVWSGEGSYDSDPVPFCPPNASELLPQICTPARANPKGV